MQAPAKKEATPTDAQGGHQVGWVMCVVGVIEMLISDSGLDWTVLMKHKLISPVLTKDNGTTLQYRFNNCLHYYMIWFKLRFFAL